MLQALRIGVVACGAGCSAIFGFSPAEAACQLVTATASEGTPAEAARTSQGLVVKGDPFWKAVRPNGVHADARIKPDIVTFRFYTTCFTGVVVPYVCTTGSAACGQ